jgi:hypothetical protein
LVFVFVCSCEEAVNGFAVFFDGFFTAVVSGGDVVGASLFGYFEKGSEFDFSVTEDVGVGGASLFVFPKHILDYLFTVLFAQIYFVKRYLQFFCYELRQ